MHYRKNNYTKEGSANKISRFSLIITSHNDLHQTVFLQTNTYYMNIL